MTESARTETTTPDATAVWHACRLGRGVGEVARGRELLRRFVVEPGGPARPNPYLVGDLLVIVSELVTNTLDHTGERPVVVLGRRGRLVHVEVRDAAPGLPHERTAAPGEPHGRGLVLVSRLSDRHGVRTLPGGGKAVWAELDV